MAALQLPTTRMNRMSNLTVRLSGRKLPTVTKKPIKVRGVRRLLVRVVAAMTLLFFTGAAFQCALGDMLESQHHDGQSAAPTHHRDSDSDSEHGHQHEDSSSCCTNLKTPIPSAQQTTLKPQPSAVDLILALLPAVSQITEPAPASSLDHGPPGTSRPEFLLVSSVAPRSPPFLA